MPSSRPNSLNSKALALRYPALALAVCAVLSGCQSLDQQQVENGPTVDLSGRTPHQPLWIEGTTKAEQPKDIWERVRAGYKLQDAIGVNPRIGVFLDWGLGKDLLLPAREQDGPLNPGDRVVVQVVLDDKTDRLIASARLNRRLDLTPPPYHEGESVHLLVASKSPLGYNLIINHAHRGLVYNTDLAAPLQVKAELPGPVEIEPVDALDKSPLPVGAGVFRPRNGRTA